MGCPVLGNGVITFHVIQHGVITCFVHEYRLPVEILIKIIGNQIISSLVNTYYNPIASGIAKMLMVA